MLNTPSTNLLPRQIDPRKFAQQGIEVSGSVELATLTRICDVLSSSEGDVHAELVFGISEQRILNVVGRITASLQHICQRCLGPIPVTLSCELQLAIVWDEEKASALPKSYDPWIVGEGQTDIYQIIEDELLLSLPIVSYHEEECVPYEYFSSADEGVEEAIAREQQKNPFQVLEQLKGVLPTSKDEE